MNIDMNILYESLMNSRLFQGHIIALTNLNMLIDIMHAFALNIVHLN